MGPTAVLTPSYGLVSGRVSSLALDPSDSTGNTLYVGTTGGGAWVSHNAAATDVSSIRFTPLTDQPTSTCPPQQEGPVPDASISIGAVSVQPPGGSGIILAGTGDPNDALDSYYGEGLLRSADGGKSWTLIQGSSDLQAGYAANYGFIGEGFAGFAWSDPQTVVAAVSQSRDSFLVSAGQPNYSYSGLYYSTQSGDCGTWHLARIVDGNGMDVQGPDDPFAGTEGNAATAVVWNPNRSLFIAAIRFHGYYSSPDGQTWTRLASQPGAAQTTLTTSRCPTNPTAIGSRDCPIFRGALAVNPTTGDTFAWTVDENNQDQGLWQDTCNLDSHGKCASANLSFATHWDTGSLQTSTLDGPPTLLNGDYNMVLTASPGNNNDTLLLAGANDLWKCSLAADCQWRNTTNSTSCKSAQVGEYQHALAWNASNPLEIFAGNDSGLWRSADGIAESGQPCSSDDASHWQNLNGSIGSLAEVESMSQIGASPYTMMVGLGANGTAGVKNTTGPAATWSQILTGEGGPVAIDPTDPDNWYVNNQAGVSIYLCSSTSPCSPSDFGDLPVVSNADVGGDGTKMTEPAPFLVDPADPTQLLIATCRLWRGPANGLGWRPGDQAMPMLGTGASSLFCSGNPLIRSLVAAKLSGGGEVVYAGTYGRNTGGADLPGHVLKATMDSSGAWSPEWTDLTFNPVAYQKPPLNSGSFDISAITIDPHDKSGNTVYATIEGIAPDNVSLVYLTTDGGTDWTDATSNLPYAPANALTVDPVDANTVYIATDVGVWATRQIFTCGAPGVNCWFAFGAGMPESPATTLSAAPGTASPNVLMAGTYGRGIWQIPLLTAGQQMTTASASPASLSFEPQAKGTTSDPQPVVLTNTSPIALLPAPVTITGDFTETDDCGGSVVNYGATCTIQVVFSPTRIGSRSGALTILGNISTGNIVIPLSGTGAAAPVVTLQPTSISFGSVETGTTSLAQQATAENGGETYASITSVNVTGPFVISTNGCGTIRLDPNADCSISLAFAPSKSGPATGALTMVDSAGTQTVQLSGIGTAPPMDTLSATSLTFDPTTIGATSASQNLTLTNDGGNPLTSIAVSISGPYLQTNNCTTSLTAGASCAITVSYFPTAAGSQSGALTVTDILHSQTVALNGTGLLPPGFSATPTHLTFPGDAPGQASALQTVTISNNSAVPATGIALSITGPFSLTQNQCGATLAAGASCTSGVVFTPQQIGSFTGVLKVISSAVTATVALSGYGFDFTASNSGPASQTVASGQTAGFTLALTTAGGAPASFSFECNGLPQYAACAFSPSTLSVQGGIPGSESIQITTSRNSSQNSSPSAATPRELRLPLTLACGLVLLPLALRGKRRFLLAVLLLTSLGGVVSCAGSGGGGGATPPPSNHSTAPGTYSIPVVIKSAEVQHTVTLTLVVD